MVMRKWFAWLLFWSGLLWAQPRMEAFVSPSHIQVGQTFRVTYVIEASVDRFAPPDFGNLRILAGPIQSTNIQIINGRMRRQSQFQYILQASQPGTYVLRGGYVIVHGNRYPLPEVRVEVHPASSPSGTMARRPGPAQQQQDIFIKVEVDEHQPYVGEQIRVTYKLYSRYPIANVNTSYVPNFSGLFWAYGDLLVDKLEPRRVLVNGVPYFEVLLARRYLFPRKSGRLPIDSLVLDVVIHRPVRDPFLEEFFRPFRNDPFFSQFMSDVWDDMAAMQMQPVQVHVASPVVYINARPLPPAPSHFAGLVGRWQAKATVDQHQVPVGEPVTYTVEISGTGNIKMMRIPTPPFDSTLFEVYPPEVRDYTAIKNDAVYGRRRIKWVLIPRQAGRIEIPEWQLAYFSPQQGQYVSLSVPAIELDVQGQPGLTAQALSTQDSTQVQHSAPTSGVSLLSPSVFRYLLGGAGLLALLLALVWVGRKLPARFPRTGHADPIRAYLKQAQKALARGDHQAFLQAVHQALWKAAVIRASLGEEAPTTERLYEALKQYDADTAHAWKELIDAITLAIYTPLSPRVSAEEIWPRARQVIQRLARKQSFPTGSSRSAG